MSAFDEEASGEKGFDDQFNDEMLRASIRTGAVVRPAPIGSVSLMRKHTMYTSQGMPNEHGDRVTNFLVFRTPPKTFSGQTSRKAY